MFICVLILIAIYSLLIDASRDNRTYLITEVSGNVIEVEALDCEARTNTLNSSLDIWCEFETADQPVNLGKALELAEKSNP